MFMFGSAFTQPGRQRLTAGPGRHWRLRASAAERAIKTACARPCVFVGYATRLGSVYILVEHEV